MILGKVEGRRQSAVGLKRENEEDAVYVFRMRRFSLWTLSK